MDEELRRYLEATERRLVANLEAHLEAVLKALREIRRQLRGEP